MEVDSNKAPEQSAAEAESNKASEQSVEPAEVYGNAKSSGVDVFAEDNLSKELQKTAVIS